MLKTDAIAFFGSQANIQKALGVSNAAVYRWGEIVPRSSAGILYVLSEHQIPFREQDYTVRRKNRRTVNPRRKKSEARND